MNKETLKNMDNISTFYKYLAYGKSIVFNNGLTNLELKMNTNSDYLFVYAKNLEYPEIDPLPYDDKLTAGYILNIIDYLKNCKSNIIENTSKWEEIRLWTCGNDCLNRADFTRRI